MAVLYPILGVLPGFFYPLDWLPGLPLILVIGGLFAGAKSLGDALDTAPDVRPVAIALYVPIMMSFLVGFSFLFAVFLHWFWYW